MVDESFASSIVLAAVILLGFFTVLSLVGLFLVFFGIFPFLLDPILSSYMIDLLWGAVLPTAISSIVGLILIITWLGWRNNPNEHSLGLVTTGIIAFICCGILPGILAIFAGLMSPKIAKPYIFTPQTLPQPAEIHHCPYCGAQASTGALYCWNCGAALEP